MKTIAATIATTLTLIAAPALANPAIQEQQDILTACQDRLFGVPPRGAETYMQTTYNQGYPIVRVIAGGVVSAEQARDINACAARTLGFQGPITGYGSTITHVSPSRLTAGCKPGAPKMYRGTLYCGL